MGLFHAEDLGLRPPCLTVVRITPACLRRRDADGECEQGGRVLTFTCVEVGVQGEAGGAVVRGVTLASSLRVTCRALRVASYNTQHGTMFSDSDIFSIHRALLEQ